MSLYYEEDQEYKEFSLKYFQKIEEFLKEFNKLSKNNQIKFMLEIKKNLPFAILNFEHAFYKNINDSKKKE